MAKNYYKILGLEKGATQDEVEKKYNELLIEFDPEKQSDDDLQEFFKIEQEKIRDAYDNISFSFKNRKNIEVKTEKKSRFVSIITFLIILITIVFFIFYNNYKLKLEEQQNKLDKQQKVIEELRLLEQERKMERNFEEEISPTIKQQQNTILRPEIIEIVEDEVEIEEELLIEDIVSNEDEIIEIEEDDDEFFMVVDNMPEFPGGDLGIMRYIQRNVKYPQIAKDYNITGKVYVQFIVDKTGEVTNVKVVRGVDKNLDAEAVRVIKSLPKYKPGKQNGKPVRVMFTIPINFTLN